MRCPYCHVDNDRVLTRGAEGGYMVEERESATHVKDVFLQQKRLKIKCPSVKVIKHESRSRKIRRGIERAARSDQFLVHYRGGPRHRD